MTTASVHKTEEFVSISERLAKALVKVPEGLREHVAPLVQSSGFHGVISKEEFASLLEKSGFSDTDARFGLLPLAAAYSLAPISKFYVGAIARGESGTLYFGANMEFIGCQLSQTIHAEQCSIAHAWVSGEVGLKDITITYSPCGHCRQFMNETVSAKTLMVFLKDHEPFALHDLLPLNFGPDDLDVDIHLLSDTDNGLKVPIGFEDDQLVQSAVDAANVSHAPYTKCWSGLALETPQGIFRGIYAENAAFNPSLPPLQVALIHASMSGVNLSSITRAVLVESTDAYITHEPYIAATLSELSPSATLTTLKVE